jgi:hypothetical protein
MVYPPISFPSSTIIHVVFLNCDLFARLKPECRDVIADIPAQDPALVRHFVDPDLLRRLFGWLKADFQRDKRPVRVGRLDFLDKRIE